MAKGYVIKNVKSEYFFTRTNHFEKLGHTTYIYKDYRSAYKDLERAANCQMWDIVEAIYGTDRWHIDDIDLGLLDNIHEHIELKIRGLYMTDGDVS